MIILSIVCIILALIGLFIMCFTFPNECMVVGFIMFLMFGTLSFMIPVHIDETTIKFHTEVTSDVIYVYLSDGQKYSSTKKKDFDAWSSPNPGFIVKYKDIYRITITEEFVVHQ